MGRAARIGGGLLVGLCALLVGCTTGQSLAQLAPGESLVADITPRVDPRLARAQLPEPGQFAPPSLPPRTPAAPPTPNIQQTKLLSSAEVRVKVRAWVNGKPLFDDEVMQVAGPQLQRAYALPEPRRSEKVAEVFNSALEQVIDQEVMYQDAVKKLEKNNPKALDKLKVVVGQEFDKQLQKMRNAGVTDEQIKEVEHVARKLMERNLIATEYARNRILPYLQSVVSLEEVREYYETHKNEFQSVDKVQWQDVFIAVGPKHPTVADAKRFAQQLIAKCRTPDDFAKLVEFDDGDSKFRGGEGLGRRRGEIKPPELEPYLFQMKDGQIGPVVELPTGVHVFRLLKRDYAGQVPLDDATQRSIRKKLEGQIAEREYQRIVRELRGRSVIRVERERE